MEDENLQSAAAQLADAVNDLDTDLLARMTPDQRARQLAAREDVAEHFDRIWDGLKLRGLAPADDDHYAGAAGLRDLTANLRDVASEAAYDAGDYDEDGEAHLNPALAAERETERRRLVGQWLKNADLAELEAAAETVNPADILDLAEAIAERRTPR